MSAPMKIGADMCLSQVSGRAVFLSLGRKGVVSGPVKLRSNSTGVFAVSVRRFPRSLIGSKESRRLNENESNQGKCHGIPPSAAV